MNSVKIKNTITIISLIVSCFVFVEGINSDFVFLWVLPFSFGLLWHLSSLHKIIFQYIGVTILNSILFFRYVVTPFFSSYFEIYYMSTAAKTGIFENNLAIFLMVYEMSAIFLVQNFFLKRLLTLKDKYNIQYKPENLNKTVLIILTFSIGFLIAFPVVYETANFIYYRTEEFPNLNSIQTIALIFIQISLNFYFVYFLINYLNKKANNIKSNKTWIFLSAFLLIGTFWGGSRISILTNALIVVYFLNYFNFANRIFYLSILSLAILSILSITALEIYKSESVVVFQEPTETIFNDKNTLADNLQAYFGGHHLIATSVDLEGKGTHNILTFFNEFWGSVIFIRQLFPPNDDQTTKLFNQRFGHLERNSMIIPSLGQSFLYFSYLGAPLLSMLFTILLYKAEISFRAENFLPLKFSYLYLIVWVPFFPMQNLNIISATVFNVFFPLFVFMYFLKKTR